MAPSFAKYKNRLIIINIGVASSKPINANTKSINLLKKKTYITEKLFYKLLNVCNIITFRQLQ